MDKMLMEIDIKSFLLDFWPIILMIVLLGLFVLVANCKVYIKAGRKWWEAIIPVYNVLVWFDMIHRSRHLIWVYVPIIGLMFMGETAYAVASIGNLVFTVWLNYELVRRFGKGLGFALGAVVLPFVYWPILAWGKVKYRK